MSDTDAATESSLPFCFSSPPKVGLPAPPAERNALTVPNYQYPFPKVHINSLYSQSKNKDVTALAHLPKDDIQDEGAHHILYKSSHSVQDYHKPSILKEIHLPPLVGYCSHAHRPVEKFG